MKTCFAVAALLAFSTFPQLVLAEGGPIMSGNARYPGCKDFIAENPSRVLRRRGMRGNSLMASSIGGVSTAFARPQGSPMVRESE